MLEEKNIGYAQNGFYNIFADIKSIANGKFWAQNVPEFTGGTFDGVYSGGDSSFIVCINECERKDLLDYVKKLEECGYKKADENKIGDNLFFTYQNGVNYVYAYFIESFKSVKIIAEPYYEYINFTKEKNLVKPMVIASSACDRNFYVRLPDNTLVVIDGGWRIEDWSRCSYTDLLGQMYDEMREILGGDEIIKVSLWIVTHAHTDHTRVLEFLHTMPLAQKFEISQILYNFPCNNHLIEGGKDTTPEQLCEMQENLENWHRDAGIKFPYEKIFYNCPFKIYDTVKYENICREAFKKYNAVQIKAHDGMKLNLSGFLFEVIHTQDDDMPAMFNNNNNISIIIKMTYKNSSMLWLGDMCEIPSTSCVKMYGDFLKSDCMQVSHHGWGAATPEFYDMVKPTVLFWNNSEFGFKYSDKYQGYGKTKISTDLYNMDCVKRNIFCNGIKMSYVEFPVEIPKEKNFDAKDCQIIASGISDRIFMIKTPENKLIVIDGGWRKEFWDDFEHDVLIKKLYNEMADALGCRNVTVAAWFVTNSYKHNNRFLETYQNTEISGFITIEKIIYNFPENARFLNFDNDTCYSNLLEDEFAKTGAKLITANSDDEYSIGSVKAKILYAPKNESFSSISDSSLVFKLEFKGQSIIFTGDMTDRISCILLEQKREELSCDAVQIANHGWNNCGVLEFYKACNAKLQLWNNSEYGYRFFRKDEGYKKSQISTDVYSLDSCVLNVFCDQVKPQIFSFPLKDEEL
ncbi:MAG: hypothetical protein E7562_00810 [Ruminococcaceae bacterium]|nr:hypothetical protein [Oscillospiraceae bacterium]